MRHHARRTSGDRIGPFDLVRWLGQGSAGEVWEAVLHGPAGFRKPVALKLLRDGPGDAATRGMLLHEARLGAQLQHPNVVGTLQLAEHDGVWCLALELVRGLSVEGLCRHARGALAPGVVVDIGAQAAAALEHVHSFRADGVHAGLVHRDVKPANLLVDRTGLVKLADLGICEVRGEPGRAAGTPGYMAPEQAHGRPEPRSDLFALGAVLYAIATGHRPFGKGAEALAAVQRVEALLASGVFLAPIERALPGLAQVVRRCLRHDPADRPASAAEVLAELAALGADLPRGPTLLELLGRAAPDLAVAPAATPASEVPTRVVPLGDLRPPRDAFVGRAAELAQLVELVRAERWVVLLGPGGAGKTRLALEVARRIRLTGHAWALDLSRARTALDVCGAVATTLGIELDPSDPAGHLGRVLAAKGPVLVVLDNLEQCVAALPDTLGRWIDDAPEVQFLGTTRVLTGLRCERAVAVGELGGDDAVALFVARAPRPLSAAERAAAADLCAALDHMPLAIELAAARLRVLDVAAIRARLSLALLSGGGAERPERHRSVAASLGWSWELLSPAARLALAQLSVFEGGWDLAAAEATLDLRAAAGAPWAIQALHELADASLLQVDGAGSRFRMRVVVREFAMSRLAPDEQVRAEERHGGWYAQLGSPEAIAALEGPGGVDRHLAYVRELDNLVAACRRAVARGASEVAVRALAAADAVLARQGPALSRVELATAVAGLPGLSPDEQGRALGRAAAGFREAGRHEEAERAYVAALERCRDPATTGRLLGELGVLRVTLGRPEGAQALCDVALARVREAHDRRAEGAVLRQLGFLLLNAGRMEEARTHYEGALALAREVGDRVGEGIALSNLALLARNLGRLAETRDYAERARAVHHEVGNRIGEGTALFHLGTVEHLLGHADQARADLEASLAICREVGNLPGAASALARLASVLAGTGHLDEARGHAEAAVALHRGLAAPSAEAVSRTTLARVLQAQGRFAEALAQDELALEQFRAVGDLRSEAVALGAVGVGYVESGRADEAKARFDQALEIARAVGDRRLQGVVLLYRGDLAVAQGRLGDARADLDEARVWMEEAGDRRTLGMILTTSARLALGQGPEAGLPVVDRAIALFRESGSEDSVAIALAVRAELLHRAGDAAGARASLDEAAAYVHMHAEGARQVARVRALLDT